MGVRKPPSPPSLGLPPPSAHPGIMGSMMGALKTQRDRAQAAKFTADDTISTSPQGLMTRPTVAKSTLLGQ